jgi:predicted ATPase
VDFDQPPVVSVTADPDRPLSLDRWPADIPAVAQLLREGLTLPPGVTFLVGENGSGKSTIVEAIAMAYGLGSEGGSTGSRHVTRDSESPLSRSLRLRRGLGAGRWGFFLRAETMHGFYTYLEDNPRPLDSPGPQEPVFHELSHGESFLAVIGRRFDSPGFYCLDEPEAALSFTSTLSLMASLIDLAAAGGQVLCATHSPVLAALPGARLLEVGDWGLRETTWDELDLVWHWRRFLGSPEAYLRHLDPERV